jgi:hypothetical protein
MYWWLGGCSLDFGSTCPRSPNATRFRTDNLPRINSVQHTFLLHVRSKLLQLLLGIHHVTESKSRVRGFPQHLKLRQIRNGRFGIQGHARVPGHYLLDNWSLDFGELDRHQVLFLPPSCSSHLDVEAVLEGADLAGKTFGLRVPKRPD